MRKIILTSLFFCLAITTVVAQVVTTNIAAPNSNGLSNNQVDDFDVATDGTILNNSAADGTAEIGGTAVTGNSNITVGSEADLILLQVTGSSGSNLYGTIEVFGSEAGLIIANPNGIECDGCGFINTSKVDLVTGTANFSGDDLTGFSIDDAARFFVRNTGFVSDAVADELNLVSRDLRIQAQVKANNTLRVLAGNETYDYTTNIITSDDTEVSAHSIQINASGSLEANYIELISTEISSSHGVLNAGGDIDAGSLKLDSNGLFRNQEGGGNLGDINISGLLEVIIADRFINNGNITANTLTITTDEFFNNHNGTTQLGKIVVTDIFSLSTPSASYTNTGTVESDSLNLATSGDFTHESTTLNNFTFNDLNLNVGGNYSYSSSSFPLSDDFTWATNDSLTVSGNADIAVSKFSNSGNIMVTDTLTLALDHLQATSIINNGTVASDSLNFIIGIENHSLYPSGLLTNFSFNNLSLDVDQLTNVGSLNVPGTLTISHREVFTNNQGATIDAGSFDVIMTESPSDNNGFINRGTITVANDFSVIFEEGVYGNFLNGHGLGGNEFSGTITAGSFDATVGSNFLNSYSSSITADSFNVTAYDFRNTQSSMIDANSFNVTTDNNFQFQGNSMINADTATIKAINNFDQASSAGLEANTLTINTANFYGKVTVSNGGSVTANTLNFIFNGGFENINMQYIILLDRFTFNNLGITTKGNFINHYVTNNDFIEDITTIFEGSFNLNVGGDFTDNNTNKDFTWNENYSLNVAGDANITTKNYTQYGVINVAGAWSIDTANDFTYSNENNDFIWDTNDSLAVSRNANITTNNYTQSGVIDVDGTLNISAVGDFTNFTAGSINADTLAITVGEGTIDNDGTITTTSSLTIDTDAIHNSGNITANTSLTITATNNVFSGGSIITDALNIGAGSNFANHGDITADSLGITAGNTAINQGSIASTSLDLNTDDFFRNLIGGNISVDSLNITAGGKVTNIATINAATLNIIANNDSSRTDDTTGFYVANRGDVQATNFNITAEDNFYNRGDIIADTFNITKAKDIFFFNEEIATYTAEYDGGNIYLTGNSSFTADGGRIENYGNISFNGDSSFTADGGRIENYGNISFNGDSSFIADGGRIENYGNISLGNNLDITADSFINHEDATIDTAAAVATLNLTVNSFINDGTIDARIIIDATVDQ